MQDWDGAWKQGLCSEKGIFHYQNREKKQNIDVSGDRRRGYPNVMQIFE